MVDSASLTLQGPLTGQSLKVTCSAASDLQGVSSVVVKGRVQWQSGSARVGSQVSVSGLGGGHPQNTAPQGCQPATAQAYGDRKAGFGGSHAG
jgi:hypothetical protein